MRKLRFKKNKYTNAIFENVRQVNALADSDTETLRISVDTKAVVHVGEYSRGGRSHCLNSVAAWDHDMQPKEKLTPGGILEPGRTLLPVKSLVINMDNGPEWNGHRSQFLFRMVQFADTTGLVVRLVYYPPYHSKYNSIEHYWAGLV